MSLPLKIVVAAHKPYWMPKDLCYVPVQVGAAGKDSIEGFLRDNTDENISEKNPNYCELTGLYWAWKNLDADYLGLAHYRRHFATRYSGNKKTRVASGEQLMKVISTTGIILPKPRHYYIETNYSQYVHAHHVGDLEITRDIIAIREPKMVWKYDEIMNRTYGHRFNMFVMRRDLANAWCEWLFDILFQLESRLDISDYSPYDARVFGFVSERLLDYWVESNGLACTEIPVVNLESQHWVRKGASFVARKLKTR